MSCNVHLSPRELLLEPAKLSVNQNSLCDKITNATYADGTIDNRDICLRLDNCNFYKKNSSSNSSREIEDDGTISHDRTTLSTKKLTTNVQVCARIRPLHSHPKSKERKAVTISHAKERHHSFSPGKNLFNRRNQTSTAGRNKKPENDGAIVAWDVSDDCSSVFQSNKTEKIQGRTYSYTLDRIFGTSTTTDEIYHESVASLVKAAMEGYNSTILAYGQTSTGKTHTMTGKRDNPGLVPLCVKDCFKHVQKNASGEPREYLFRFSYLEIYKEHIRDLLASTTSAPEPIRLFDGPDGLVIRGLNEVVVSSPNKVFQLLKQGEKRRQVGATHMNQHSSRSHVIVRLKIESSFAKNKSDETRVSVLSLVDLAGSESVRLNGTERREEGQYINKSLMALGQVVNGLSESCNTKGDFKKKIHIPYRDSKLTRLLQSSLSGNAQMLLVCCISPLLSHLEESHNTFKFATRAKRIEQNASIQTAKDEQETLLQTYRNEIEDLKQQLAEATKQKEQLLEEQRTFQTRKQRGDVPLENVEVVATAITNNIEVVSTTMTTSTVNSSNEESNTVQCATGEIEELVEAIQTMEQLILKSRPLQQQNSHELHNESKDNRNEELDEMVGCALQLDDVKMETDADLLDGDDVGIQSNSMVHNNVITLLKSPDGEPITPHNPKKITANSGHLHSELTRVRGLLATVLQKRGIASTPRSDISEVGSTGYEQVRKSLDFSTPFTDPPLLYHIIHESLSEELDAGMNVERIIGENHIGTRKEIEEKSLELESLRMQLKQQERTTSLRKADSHFLQIQLEEKDKLLEEVSSLLEAVERRQTELERENTALVRELNLLREERGEEREIIMSLP